MVVAWVYISDFDKTLLNQGQNHLSTPLGETVWGTIDMKNPLIAYALCSDQAPI